MSVVSKNPFDLLGDDGDSPSPAPAPKPAATPAASANKAAEPAKPRNVPGSAARGGRYPSRGAPRNVFRGEGEPRNTGPTSGDGVAEGMETAGGFDGERVAPSKKHRGGVPDAHTKGPRGSRPARNLTSGGHTASGGGASRRGRTPNFGGERRQFERRSGTLPDSQKKVEHGWGSNEGGAELSAEVEGFKDAVAEENAPETPAPEGEEGASAEAPAAAAEPEQAGEPEEPEEVQKSYDEYLAEKAAQALQFGKKASRQVEAEALEGTAFVREAIDDFFSGKEKTGTKSKAPKKEKVYIEVDGQFATPAGRPTRGTGERGGRGGRGGARGGEGRGRGAPRGGRGAPRGGRGGFGGPVVNASDEKAFPALGA